MLSARIFCKCRAVCISGVSAMRISREITFMLRNAFYRMTRLQDLPSEFQWWNEYLKSSAAISNPLDHVASPKQCIENIRRVMKPGGFVYLEGFCREGTNAKWSGLHQHDLF